MKYLHTTIIYIIFSFTHNNKQLFSQVVSDSKEAPITITKNFVLQCPAGASLIVPENKIWKVKQVLLNDGLYNIVVKTVKYEQEYKGGKKIVAPFFSSEGTLLNTEKSPLLYTFEIEETETKK